MSEDLTLEKLRARIDKLDASLLAIFNERAGIAKEIARLKSAQMESSDFYCPDRETLILRKVIAENPGPLSEETIAYLFRQIMSACLALEQTLDIAYLGPEGTFTQIATWKHFGHAVQTVAMDSIDQIFREVESDRCQYGVVPVENSIEGAVNHTLDLLIDCNLLICGEVDLPIHHHLLSNHSAITDLKEVYSHQQSLAQCRNWLDRHLPKAERIVVSSNAEAARMVSGKKNAAAIAGESAAELYDLSVLARNIENEAHNTTRFLVLGKKNLPPSGQDKTSLLFSTPNKPGALQKMLACFSDNGISLTKIESRPLRKGMWEYVFFADIEGHTADTTVALALNKLNDSAAMVKLLGSYPRAVF